MYKFYEVIPGALAWGTLILMVVFSWKLPTPVAIFTILFDTYWVLKTIYLLFHLRATYVTLKKNLGVNWLERLEKEKPKNEAIGIASWRDVYHLIIFPMYKEPYEVVSESFQSLMRAKYPKDRMIIVLALEERAGEDARKVGERISREFGDKFFKFAMTSHPFGLPGEIPGKGSNEAWAATQVKASIIDQLGMDYRHILTSVFDIDTQAADHYFSRLTHLFLTAPDPLHAIYQPIPFFNNNVYEAPAIARVVSFSTTFWNMMQQSRPEVIRSFSSQSLPFQVLVDVGFWERNVVSEDGRIFWQGLLRYDGKFRVEPMCYPVSMDVNVGKSFWETLKNQYKQQRRWGWGAEDIPYLLDRFPKKTGLPKKTKLYWLLHVFDDFHSWATSSIMIFALGWLPVWLGGRVFNDTLLSYNLPKITQYIVSLSTVGIATSAIVFMLLLPDPPKGFKKSGYLYYVLQWLLAPVTLIIFGAFPALDAQTRLMIGGKWRLGFWVTPKGRKKAAVEAKVQ